MHGYYIVLGLVLAVIGIVSLVVVPFFAPWRIRLRWMLASQHMDAGFGLPAWSGIFMREVRVTGVALVGEQIELALSGVLEDAAGLQFSMPASPATLARLEGWHAARESLLLVSDESGARELHGPDSAVGGLQPFRRTAASSAPSTGGRSRPS